MKKKKRSNLKPFVRFLIKRRQVRRRTIVCVLVCKCAYEFVRMHHTTLFRERASSDLGVRIRGEYVHPPLPFYGTTIAAFSFIRLLLLLVPLSVSGSPNFLVSVESVSVFFSQFQLVLVRSL